MAKRTYPVDFRYRQMWRLRHEITLPRGWKVKLLPDSLAADTAGFSVVSRTGSTGPRLVNEAVFREDEQLLPLADYDALRGLTARCEQVDRQHVMLKKGEE
jgi:hypothetical protein